MAVNFPENPDLGQQVLEAGKLFVWDGSRWVGRVTTQDTVIISPVQRNVELIDDNYDANGDEQDNFIVIDDADLETPPLTFALFDNTPGTQLESLKKDSGVGLGYYPRSNTLFSQQLAVADFTEPNETRNNFFVGQSGIEYGPTGNLAFRVNRGGLTHTNNITGKVFRTAASSLDDPELPPVTGKATASNYGTFSLDTQGQPVPLYGFTMIEANSVKVNLACWSDDGTATVSTNFEIRRVQSTIRVVDEKNNVVDVPDPVTSPVVLPVTVGDPALGLWVAYNGPVPGLSLQFGVFKNTPDGTIDGQFRLTSESFLRV